MALILAGDIGGTSSRIALYEQRGDRLDECALSIAESRRHDGLEGVVRAALASAGVARADLACVGVAGPVLDGTCRLTNLGWTVTESGLAAAAGARRARLLNDLQAAAFAMPFLPADSFAVLNAGVPPRTPGTMAVVAAGTGLGAALLVWDGERYHPIPGEAGHADFAPRNEREIGLWRALAAEHGGHVSNERVLSGSGIVAIHRHLAGAEASARVRERAGPEGAAAEIAGAGLAGADAACVATLELFARLYGAVAGNLALTCLATSGVVLAGGIAPRLLPVLQSGAFMDGFADKGRFAPLLRDVPVRVALSTEAGLIGAARYALRL